MPSPRGVAGALSGHRRPSSVCLSDVAYIGSNSKTKRPRKTKVCTGVPRSHATPTPTSKSKGQKSRWGGGILWRPPSRTACFLLFCHIYCGLLSVLLGKRWVDQVGWGVDVNPLPPLGHVMLVWRKGNVNKNCLCVTALSTAIMVQKDHHHNHHHPHPCHHHHHHPHPCHHHHHHHHPHPCHHHHHRALILLGLALCLPSTSVSSVFIVNFFAYIFFFTF